MDLLHAHFTSTSRGGINSFNTGSPESVSFKGLERSDCSAPGRSHHVLEDRRVLARGLNHGRCTKHGLRCQLACFPTCAEADSSSEHREYANYMHTVSRGGALLTMILRRH